MPGIQRQIRQETNSECQQIAQLTIGLELSLGLGFRLSNYDMSWIQSTILLVDSHFHFVRTKPSIIIRWNKILLFYWWQYMCIYCGLSQQKLLKQSKTDCSPDKEAEDNQCSETTRIITCTNEEEERNIL